MATPKKIFFSYSSTPEDLEWYKKINKHFSVYQGMGLLGIIDKNELFKLAPDKDGVTEILKNSDIAIPLLSIDYVNDTECLQQLETASLSQVTVIPVLLRDFDWEAFNKIALYKQQLLPNDHTPVENYKQAGTQNDSILKEIAWQVKKIILPNIGQLTMKKTSQVYYYVLTALVCICGGLFSWYIFDKTKDYRILIIAMLITIVIALIALKNVVFPNKVFIQK